MLLETYRTKPCRRCGTPKKEVHHSHVGLVMRKERQRSGLTASEVARRLNVSAPYLFDLENGRRPWNIDIASRYLRALVS